MNDCPTIIELIAAGAERCYIDLLVNVSMFNESEKNILYNIEMML